MNRFLHVSVIIIVALYLFGGARCAMGQNAPAGAPAAVQAISMGSLLNEMTDRDAIARWPEPSFILKQASSYDRASVTPDDPKGWFANGDSGKYIRKEQKQGRTENVMLDSDGPGAIVRFWMTSRTIGTIRIYLDGSETPEIETAGRALLVGEGFVKPPLAMENPAGSSEKNPGGMNLYLPIPFARHCKITTDKNGYYNINYRIYAAGTPVKSFTMNDYQKSTAEVERAQNSLKNSALELKTGSQTANSRLSAGGKADGKLAPGKTLALELPAGSKAVRELEVILEASDLQQATRSVIVKGVFDDEETIWAPVGEFFGSGIGVNPTQDWYRTVTADGKMVCRWVMPYKKTGTISLVNLGKQDVNAKISVSSDNWRWDERSMHFHATWSREKFPTAEFRDFNYVTAKGKGVYAGDTLAIFNPVSAWWGEGDEKVWVDGEKFPSSFGTGTEDYYGYAWCRPTRFQGPFCIQPRADGPGNKGHTTNSRIRSLDGIPFTKSLQFDMEAWHWNRKVDITYAATAYWYALPGATSNRSPQPEAAALPIEQPPVAYRVANAIECEKMEITGKAAGTTITTQDMGQYKDGQWSEDVQLFVQGHKIGMPLAAQNGHIKFCSAQAAKARRKHPAARG
ncbi:MAG: DUF2961 domain-containing protein [Candidatus Sumerlaeota bacterium]|nr:DUF2961 domain-containing protein [Candidatus Sumerlaeota bacterium]